MHITYVIMTLFEVKHVRVALIITIFCMTVLIDKINLAVYSPREI